MQVILTAQWESVTQIVPQLSPDYPQTWAEFVVWFSDEARCAAYLERLRWPEGFVCPQCRAHGEPYRASRGRLVCRSCGKQSSVTAGTVFEKTRTPLRSWFAAAWYMTNQKHGISALGLQRLLGLGSYQTAWTLLHRLRRVMGTPGERLHGVVEVDAVSVGGRDTVTGPVRHRGGMAFKAPPLQNIQSIVAIAVETLQPKGIGRVRLRRVSAAAQATAPTFLDDCIVPGSIVRRSSEPAQGSLPAVRRVASLLKRWLLATHQGSVQPEHLDHYLNEFTFRFNRRTARSRGLLFRQLLAQAAEADPITYQTIVTARSVR